MSFMKRSDPMTYCEMFLPPEVAFETLALLGELGCVQFLDASPELSVFQRRYVAEMCRCAELERKLRLINEEMQKDNIFVPTIYGELPSAMPPSDTTLYETTIEKWYEDIEIMSRNRTDLLNDRLGMSELLYVLTETETLLGDVELRRDSLLFPRQGPAGDAMGGVLFVKTGVIDRQKSFTLETMLWRISRGNIYFRTAALDKAFEDPANSGIYVRKVAFLAVSQGQKLSDVVDRVCTAFRAHFYDVPKTYSERSDLLRLMQTKILDLDQVLQKSTYFRCKSLRSIGRLYHKYMIQVQKSRAVFQTMNLFNVDITRKCLIGQCWVPTRDIKIVQDVLDRVASKAGSSVHSFLNKVDTMEEPPTYHRNNKFTRGFQNLICAYGDSDYRELNPGLYTIITFPFLFSIMFGDFGHGMILAIFAGWMVINEKKFIAQHSTNEIWNIFFGGRYIVLLMGAFSVYAGFIYNDLFSKSVTLSSSYWVNQFFDKRIIEESELLQFDPRNKTGFPYVFGMDPIWSVARNKILFMNSLKMKLSVIIGIFQMMFGLVLSLWNSIFFKRPENIILVFLPEMIFLTSIFGWLVFLIFFKWFYNTAKSDDIKIRPGCAPQILIHFIDMCLMRGTVVKDPNCPAYFFKPQGLIQKALLIVGILCVPVLLLGPPIFKLKTNKGKRRKAKEELRKHQALMGPPKEGVIDRKGELLQQQVDNYSSSAGDLIIQQGVHTIEFVLSCVSHTASYLRLWALSLAHGQLSEMLWKMLFAKLALQRTEAWAPIMIFIIFALWAMFTIFILVIMEGLSAFLHTLRLHWVEFMSKFYSGSGHPFRPFSFVQVIGSDAKEDKHVLSACKKGKVHIRQEMVEDAKL